MEKSAPHHTWNLQHVRATSCMPKATGSMKAKAKYSTGPPGLEPSAKDAHATQVQRM
jgi:hypothetical protein